MANEKFVIPKDRDDTPPRDHSNIPPREREVIRAIIEALHVPRNRFGKLDGDGLSAQKMYSFAQLYQLPHGGYDRVDQACMLLQTLIGQRPVSILNDGTQS